MNPFSSLFSSYLRWRHSRGFGVHSPFAYNLVDIAVRPGIYGFYGYDLIEDALLSPQAKPYPRLRKDARLLLRFAAMLNPDQVLVYPCAQPVFKAAARGAGIPVDYYPLGSGGAMPKGKTLLLTRGALPDGEEIRRLLNGGVAIMAIEPDKTARGILTTGVSRGVVFKGTRIVIAIPRDEMAFVSYSMKL